MRALEHLRAIGQTCMAAWREALSGTRGWAVERIEEDAEVFGEPKVTVRNGGM